VQVRIMGREIPTPRWQQAYGPKYFFSGLWHDAEPFPVELAPLMQWANTLGLGTFNQLFVNWYKDGYHYVGTKCSTLLFPVVIFVQENTATMNGK
jgi:hypothetical protein